MAVQKRIIKLHPFFLLIIVIPHRVWDPLGRHAKYSGRLVPHGPKYQITRCHNSAYHSIKNKLAALRTPRLTTLHHRHHHHDHHLHHCHQLIRLRVNLLKPTGHVTHQQFNIRQLYVLPTLYLCVLYLSENKQLLVPHTA